MSVYVYVSYTLQLPWLNMGMCLNQSLNLCCRWQFCVIINGQYQRGTVLRWKDWKARWQRRRFVSPCIENTLLIEGLQNFFFLIGVGIPWSELYSSWCGAVLCTNLLLTLATPWSKSLCLLTEKQNALKLLRCMLLAAGIIGGARGRSGPS
jgi:hypothetical protein